MFEEVEAQTRVWERFEALCRVYKLVERDLLVIPERPHAMASRQEHKQGSGQADEDEFSRTVNATTTSKDSKASAPDTAVKRSNTMVRPSVSTTSRSSRGDAKVGAQTGKKLFAVDIPTESTSDEEEDDTKEHSPASNGDAADGSRPVTVPAQQASTPATPLSPAKAPTKSSEKGEIKMVEDINDKSKATSISPDPKPESEPTKPPPASDEKDAPNDETDKTTTPSQQAFKDHTDAEPKMNSDSKIPDPIVSTQPQPETDKDQSIKRATSSDSSKPTQPDQEKTDQTDAQDASAAPSQPSTLQTSQQQPQTATKNDKKNRKNKHSKK